MKLQEATLLERIDVLEAQGGGAAGSPTSAAGARVGGGGGGGARRDGGGGAAGADAAGGSAEDEDRFHVARRHLLSARAEDMRRDAHVPVFGPREMVRFT